jgi:hypothetical protein
MLGYGKSGSELIDMRAGGVATTMGEDPPSTGLSGLEGDCGGEEVIDISEELVLFSLELLGCKDDWRGLSVNSLAAIAEL